MIFEVIESWEMAVAEQSEAKREQELSGQLVVSAWLKKSVYAVWSWSLVALLT